MIRWGETRKTKYDLNIIEIFDDHAEVVIENKDCVEIARCIISLDKVDIVKPYRWHKSSPYIVSKTSGEQVFLHKLVIGAVKGQMVDHIDGNILNCLNENLRICDDSGNTKNKKMLSSNKSGMRGVFLETWSGKWLSQIMINNKHIHLGRYESFEEAKIARLEAELKYFGEFAPILCSQKDDKYRYTGWISAKICDAKELKSMGILLGNHDKLLRQSFAGLHQRTKPCECYILVYGPPCSGGAVKPDPGQLVPQRARARIELPGGEHYARAGSRR
jgi:hypothetical protein